MSRWFRFYDGALDDPKVQGLRPALFKFWVNMLCVASKNDGKLPVADLAFLMRMDQESIDRAMEELSMLGLIDKTPDDVTPHNWDKRQFKSDVSTERVKRHRERECNVPETASETPPDNRTEQSAEQKDISRGKRASAVEAITDHFETWYSAYPLHKGRGAALKSYRKAILKTEIDVLLAAAKAFARKCAGKEQQFIAHPATWLNQERWLDEDLQPPKPQEPMSNGQTYVRYGTDAGDAWEAYHRTILHKPPPRDTKGGWYFPTEWPPTNVQRETSDQAA